MFTAILLVLVVVAGSYALHLIVSERRRHELVDCGAEALVAEHDRFDVEGEIT